MVVFLSLIGVVLFGVSGRLVARSLVTPRLQLKSHLRAINDYGFGTPDVEAELSSIERFKRFIRALAERLGAFMRSRFPQLPALEKGDLTAAGFYEISDDSVHGYRAMVAIGLPVGLFLLMSAGGSIGGLELLLLFVSLAAGWQLPSFVIRKRGAARLDDMDRQLPELIDLLIATVEAGMGFSAALKLVSERLQAPLGDEMRLTMRQQSLGMTIQQALDEMLTRCGTPSIRSFVRTAARGESMGVSIGPVLREMSSDQRRRRRQAAREKMQKAPIKMIFPLMFLIFPALMIVIMYPAAYAVTKNLSGL